MDSSPKNKLADIEAGANKEAIVKIDHVSKSPATGQVKAVKSKNARKPASSEQSAVSDEVRLTQTSEKMRHLESELSELEINDTAKIESIRQAIADGNFKVDEEAVAEGLIQESIANIGRRSR